MGRARGPEHSPSDLGEQFGRACQKPTRSRRYGRYVFAGSRPSTSSIAARGDAPARVIVVLITRTRARSPRGPTSHEHPMSPPCFLLAQIDIPDLARYRAEYIAHVVPLIHEHGGEVLVASTEAEALEGAWSGTWTVVLRFPSREQALAFYEDPAYAPLEHARITTLARGGNLALVPGREPTAR